MTWTSSLNGTGGPHDYHEIHSDCGDSGLFDFKIKGAEMALREAMDRSTEKIMNRVSLSWSNNLFLI
jgi:hypothetical protein